MSVRTVELPPFSEAETRLLLTEPLRHSPMWERDDPRRPRFDAAFWGEGGIERVHAEAAGWPHLVQLIAETAVDLLNDADAHQLNGELLERALDRAIVRGDTVLRQLMECECALPGEWNYLRAFRTRDTQPPPDDEAVHRSLRRRLLVAEADGEWRLRAGPIRVTSYLTPLVDRRERDARAEHPNVQPGSTEPKLREAPRARRGWPHVRFDEAQSPALPSI